MDRVNFKNSIKFFSLSLLVVTILLVTIWSFIIEPERIVIKKVDITLPGWNKEHKNLKVAVLSDFHIGFGAMNRNKLNTIINITNSQNPDLILLLGDYVNVSVKNKRFLNYLLDFKKFRSKYGVFAVMGNHESWQVRHKIRSLLKDAGVNTLENRAVNITIDDKSFWIAGIEDLTSGHPDLGYIMKQINDDNPVIFLSHNPNIFTQLPKNVNLAIAGHTHGGQLYIPFLVNLLNRSPFKKSFLKGYMVKNNQHFYISSGLGTTIIPARFLISPEIVFLNLN